MKKVLFLFALLGSISFLAGCSYENATTSVQDKIIPLESNKEEVPEIKKISYTTKNGLVSFLYPEKTFVSGYAPEFVNVVVEEKGDRVTVHPEGMSLKVGESGYLSLISKTKIDEDQINTFVQKTFGDNECKINFDQKFGLLWRGEIDGVLSDDEKDCNVIGFMAWYDPANKILIIKNTGKIGDFFSIDRDNSYDLQGEVHQSLRFIYLRDVFPLSYTNEKFGFTLNLPKTWGKYTVNERMLEWGEFGEGASFDFGFGFENSIFNVAVHSKEQWKTIAAEQDLESRYAQIYLGENENFVFSFASANDVANQEMSERLLEVPAIAYTFQVK